MNVLGTLKKLPEEQPLPAVSYSGERTLVRRALPWVAMAAVLGAGVLVIFAQPLVTLQRPHEGFSIAPLFSWGFLALASAPLLICVLWLWSVGDEEETGTRRGQAPQLAVLAAVLLSILSGWLLELPRSQWFFLEAVKVRAAPFSLERSTAYWKANLREASTERAQPTVALVGSSQVNFAVDDRALAEAWPGVRVWKNALPGFGLLQYLMILPALELQKANLVVSMLSEFDAYRDERLPVARMRYFGGMREKLQLFSLLPPALAWANRSEITDLVMGSLSPLWRDRDLFHLLWRDAWWPAAEVPRDGNDRALQDAVIAHANSLATSIGRTALLEVNFAAFEAFAAELEGSGTELLVLEGTTNPVATSVYDPAGVYRREARERLIAMARRAGFTYVPADAMPALNEEDFADAVHLDAAARQRFTAWLAARGCEGLCRPEAGNGGLSHD